MATGITSHKKGLAKTYSLLQFYHLCHAETYTVYVTDVT